MPVYKFRTFEEAREALWVDEVDDAYINRVEALWQRAHELLAKRHPAGVYKYRDITDPERDWPTLDSVKKEG